MQAATTAVMCRVCTHLRGTACGLSNMPTQYHRLTLTCPAGRFPDARGRVRWRGRLWSGVPMPLRLLALFKGLSRPEALPGCGCWRDVKAWFMRMDRLGRGGRFGT